MLPVCCSPHLNADIHLLFIFCVINIPNSITRIEEAIPLSSQRLALILKSSVENYVHLACVALLVEGGAEEGPAQTVE